MAGFDLADGHDLLDAAAVSRAAASPRTGIASLSLRPVWVTGPGQYRRTAEQRRADPRSEWMPFREYGAFVDVRDVATAVELAVDAGLTGHHRALLCADHISASAPSLDMVDRLAPGVPVRNRALRGRPLAGARRVRGRSESARLAAPASLAARFPALACPRGRYEDAAARLGRDHGVVIVDEPAHVAMRAYYERGEERDRLAGPRGQLEFERTKEILLRHLPPPPAVVADIGGGPGRYALWLAGLGYQVVHRDLMAMHVEQLREASRGEAHIDTGVADARDLDLADGSADAVLLLGPLYHLGRRADRVRALTEARRVVRSGGPIFVAAISRWAPRMDGILLARLYEGQPNLEGELDGIERTGHLPPFSPDGFSGYTHRPGQLRAELIASGSHIVDLVCVEGPAYLLDDLPERLADDDARRVVLDTARALERVPELLGIGPHLLATARTP